MATSDLIFLSYAHEDIDAATRIYASLTAAGLRVWFDKESLLPGQKWKLEIGKAIRSSRYFIAVISRNSVSKRGYVQKEMREALEVLDEFPESGVFLIPVRLEECRPDHEKLHEIHWLNLFPDFDAGLATLMNVLGAKHHGAGGSSVLQSGIQRHPEVEVRICHPQNKMQGVRVKGVVDISTMRSFIPESALAQLNQKVDRSTVVISGFPHNIHMTSYIVDLEIAGRRFANAEMVSTREPLAIIGRDILKEAMVLFDGATGEYRIWFRQELGGKPDESQKAAQPGATDNPGNAH